MAAKSIFTFSIFFFFTLLSLLTFSHSITLSTSGRWVVDSETGQRVKLKCVNWVAHTQSMLAEGMDKRPIKEIVGQVSKLGFNCVRLTYATQMFTRYANRTVSDNFDNLDIKRAKAGLVENNPSMLNKTIAEAFEAVIDEFGAEGLMVHIDNHISQPRWCCSLHDGNGFWGDTHFTVEEWLRGLDFVAQAFSFKPQVISMSLRNELRGPKSNVTNWYKYVARGVTTIHNTNPSLLVVVSGLNYDNDLSFLKTRGLNYALAPNKLVLEVHLYSFSGDPQSKLVKNPLNSICDRIIKKFVNEASFVVDRDQPLPLIVSEFGYDLTNKNEADNRFMTCFCAHLADKDLEWALWAWQGSYYYREGAQQSGEDFGIMDQSWSTTKLRNPNITQMLQLLQRTNQEVKNKTTIQLGDCMTTTARWMHSGTRNEPIRLVNSALCLKAVGEDKSPILSADCSSQQSFWSSISQSNLHLGTKNESNGMDMCLEQESEWLDTIVTRRCICVGDDPRCLDDPRSQWFKLILTNTI